MYSIERYQMNSCHEGKLAAVTEANATTLNDAHTRTKHEVGHILLEFHGGTN